MDVLERWLRFGLPVLSSESPVIINREAWEKRCGILISNVSLQFGTSVLELTYFVILFFWGWLLQFKLDERVIPRDSVETGLGLAKCPLGSHRNVKKPNCSVNVVFITCFTTSVIHFKHTRVRIRGKYDSDIHPLRPSFVAPVMSRIDTNPMNGVKLLTLS